jgi:hypothetical protein
MRESDLWLREHAAVHTAAVADPPFGVFDAAIRGIPAGRWSEAPPGGGNPIAWLVWHIARVEDGCVSTLLARRDSLADQLDADGDSWGARMGVPILRDGEGMSHAEVMQIAETAVIDVLLDYRIAVGRRTRDLVREMAANGRLDETISEADVARLDGHPQWPQLPTDAVGLPVSGLLWWWGIQHSIYHIGQIAATAAQMRRDG